MEYERFILHASDILDSYYCWKTNGVWVYKETFEEFEFCNKIPVTVAAMAMTMVV
jgi:hypothetical protein